MPILDNYRMVNIQRSLFVYTYAKLVTIEGLVIDWEGSDSVNIEKENEYCMPRLMVPKPKYMHMTRPGSNTFGNLYDFLYNINIFVKRGSSTDFTRLYLLRDKVANYFTIQTEIDYKNYYDSSESPESLGTLFVHDIETDSPVPSSPSRIEEESPLYMWTLCPCLRVVLEYTKI